MTDLERVRNYLSAHLGCSTKQCREALGITKARHIRLVWKLRAEWGDEEAIRMLRAPKRPPGFWPAYRKKRREEGVSP